MEKPQIADHVTYEFHGKEQHWRVESFLKRVEDGNWYSESEDYVDQIVNDVLRKCIHREQLERQELGLPANRRYRYQWCKRDEATHVSLYAVCGAIAPIEEVVSHGPVNWEPEVIQRAIDEYEDFFLLGQYTDWYWE